MFSIVITERGGAQRLLEVDAVEAGIGRLEDNEIVLPRSNVSKHHARLVLKDDRCVVVDLKSTNGTYVNGRKISAPMVVGPTDKIYIGDFILTLTQSMGSVTAERRLRSDSDTRELSQSFRPPVPELDTRRNSGFPRQGLPVPMRSPLHASVPLAPTPSSALPSAGPLSAGYTGPTLRPPDDEDEDTAAFDEQVSVEELPVADLMPDEPGSAPRLTRPDADHEAEGSRPLAPGDFERADFERADIQRGIDPTIAAGSAMTPPSRPPRPVALSTPPRRSQSMPPRVQDHESAGGPATSPAVLSPSVRLQGALSTLMERLASRMDTTTSMERAFPSEHQSALDALMNELASDGVIGPDLDRRFLTQAAVSEAVGLGPLDRLLSNRAVREVVIDGPSRILADLGGGLNAVSSFFSSNAAVIVVGRRLLARAGQDLSNAAVQHAQLPCGMQVQILMPPLSPAGPLLSVRCPPRAPQQADSLVTEGMLSIDMLNLLRRAMQKRLNVLVAGPMATGVSTMLGALGSLCPDHERLVALQDGPSLSIDHVHVLPLHRGGAGDVSFAELLRMAARLRPDRLLIDDVRAEDALALLMGAAASRGTMVGMHAPSSTAALEQIEMLAQTALGGTRSSLTGLLAQAFQLLIHVSTDSDGARRVMGIDEIRGVRGSTGSSREDPRAFLEVTALYRYDRGFKPTEHRPSFLGD